MEPDPDEAAGVVDLFGGLTRGEVRTAFSDLAARSGEPLAEGTVSEAIERALADYYLVEYEHDDAEAGTDAGTVLVAGPAALPRLPEGGEDLPHLLDVEPRQVDREAAGRAALERLQGDAARAVNEGDADRVATLLDVCYDLEAWAPVETAALRERLDPATE